MCKSYGDVIVIGIYNDKNVLHQKCIAHIVVGRAVREYHVVGCAVSVPHGGACSGRVPCGGACCGRVPCNGW